MTNPIAAHLSELEAYAAKEESVITLGAMAAHLVGLARHWEDLSTEQSNRVFEVAEAVRLDVLLSRLLR